ncbi:DUF5592 family protein [Carnobacterium divergens]|uniref:DUF5592 family protein n=1 Tax=Carnobacterium divergens TaxID=2748 RepID=A0AAW8RH12_CARDV|nr:DUF5592 family protein [Carnobacterium divergens]MDT1958973.1 DUF5592 family protein [Carnobacterium divergens]MDT1974941.1 DUF5592 family protein [Carnobacterium divergens]
MNDYSNLKIPRDIKAQVKLYMFYLVDIMVVVGLIYGGYMFQNMVQFTLGHYAMLQVTNFSLGIFLCAKPSSCPEKRNIQVIMQLLMKDQRKYVTEDYSNE